MAIAAEPTLAVSAADESDLTGSKAAVDEPGKVGGGRRVRDRGAERKIEADGKAGAALGRYEGVLGEAALATASAEAVGPHPLPTSKDAPGPRAATVPNRSRPTTNGKGRSVGQRPERTKMSAGLAAASSAGTSTSVGPGRGTASSPSAIAPGGPGHSTEAARIIVAKGTAIPGLSSSAWIRHRSSCSRARRSVTSRRIAATWPTEPSPGPSTRRVGHGGPRRPRQVLGTPGSAQLRPSGKQVGRSRRDDARLQVAVRVRSQRLASQGTGDVASQSDPLPLRMLRGGWGDLRDSLGEVRYGGRVPAAEDVRRGPRRRRGRPCPR